MSASFLTAMNTRTEDAIDAQIIEIKINNRGELKRTVTMSVGEAKKVEQTFDCFGESHTWNLYYTQYLEYDRDAVGICCVKCGYKTPKIGIDGFGKCDECCDPADYEEEEEEEDEEEEEEDED